MKIPRIQRKATSIKRLEQKLMARVNATRGNDAVVRERDQAYGAAQALRWVTGGPTISDFGKPWGQR